MGLSKLIVLLWAGVLLVVLVQDTDAAAAANSNDEDDDGDSSSEETDEEEYDGEKDKDNPNAERGRQRREIDKNDSVFQSTETSDEFSRKPKSARASIPVPDLGTIIKFVEIFRSVGEKVIPVLIEGTLNRFTKSKTKKKKNSDDNDDNNEPSLNTLSRLTLGTEIGFSEI